jgi:hypothetical protein
MIKRVKLDFTSRYAHKFCDAWNSCLSSVRLVRTFGIVSGVFIEGSEDYQTVLRLYEAQRDELAIRIDRTVHAEYSDVEKQSAELLMVFPHTVYGGVIAQYVTDETCPTCGERRPPRRVALLHADQEKLRGRHLVSNDQGEIVVSDELRDSWEGKFPSQTDFLEIPETRSFCLAIPRYKLTGRQPAEAVCKECHRLCVDPRSPECEARYRRGQQPIFDIMGTLDYPFMLCLSQEAYRVVRQHERSLTLDHAHPIVWTDAKAG